jgi:hypothetical protein
VVGTFKANSPFNIFFLFIYGLLLKLSLFTNLAAPVSAKTDGILFNDLILTLNTISLRLPVIYPLISYLLLITQAVAFNNIINYQRLIQRPGYLTGMSYLLITSVFPEWNVLSSTLIVSTLLIWVWSKINTLYNSNHPKTTLFNIGMAIGVSSLFYFPSIAFVLLVIIALVLTRPFNAAECTIVWPGIITPFHFLFVWLFLSDNLKHYRLPFFAITYPVLQNKWSIAAIIVVLIAFVTGAYFVRMNLSKQVVQTRKSWTLLFFYLLIALLIPFINNTHSFQYWILSAAPLSAFIACAFFYPTKKWFPLLLHWVMAGFVIVISYYHK